MPQSAPDQPRWREVFKDSFYEYLPAGARRPIYVVSYNEFAELWFACRPDFSTTDEIAWISFANGSLEDMKTLIEVVAKLER